MKRMFGFVFVAIVAFAIGGCTSENPDGAETDAFDYPALTPESDAGSQPSPSDDAMPQRPPEPPPPQNRPDGGIPPKSTCPEDCGDDLVCAPFGKCVPDCRTGGECPQPNMICDQNTGLCEPDPTSDAGPPPSAKCTAAEDCEDGMICSPMNTCVPDCRNGLQCPTHMPTCDQDTGLCSK